MRVTQQIDYLYDCTVPYALNMPNPPWGKYFDPFKDLKRLYMEPDALAKVAVEMHAHVCSSVFVRQRKGKPLHCAGLTGWIRQVLSS